jgi:hypothetical protein
MNLDGLRKAKSSDEIEQLIATYTRAQLAHLIFVLVRVEKHFTADEVASLESMDPATIRRDIKAGLFGGEYYARNKRQLRVSASGVAAWRASFKVRVPASR